MLTVCVGEEVVLLQFTLTFGRSSCTEVRQAKERTFPRGLRAVAQKALSQQTRRGRGGGGWENNGGDRGHRCSRSLKRRFRARAPHGAAEPRSGLRPRRDGPSDRVSLALANVSRRRSDKGNSGIHLPGLYTEIKVSSREGVAEAGRTQRPSSPGTGPKPAMAGTVRALGPAAPRAQA